MARIHRSGDVVVIAAKTSVSVFDCAETDSACELHLQRILEVEDGICEESTSSAQKNGAEELLAEPAPKKSSGDGTDVRPSARSAAPDGKGEASAEHKKTSEPSPPADRQILASAFSRYGSLFAVVTAMKTCVIYDAEKNWTLRRPTFRLPKAPTAVTFDAEAAHVLVADRSGNICRYRVDGQIESKISQEDDEDSCREGELLLGHVSMVLDIEVSESGRYVISGDRDEKVRVSRYPQSFVIHRFWLGHESYVNCLAAVKDCVFSSGGDGTIRAWDLNGEEPVSVGDCFDKECVRCFRLASTSPNNGMFTFAVVCEESLVVRIVQYDLQQKMFEVTAAIKSPDDVVDAAFTKQGNFLIAVTRKTVMVAKIGANEEFKTIDSLSAEVMDAISAAKDPEISLKKNVGFNNLEEYQQRKLERIQKMQKRKRKIEK